jgi:peptide/nickel transport system substrate-binding protein
MHFHRLKLRFRRGFRLRKRQVEGIGQQAEVQLERNFIRRLGRLAQVRRFVAGWVVLLLLLSSAVIVQTRALTGYYQTQQPIPGGIYSEGIVGAFTNANPLYASGQVDDAVSQLIFSGLFKYDDQNHLVGDLADSWSVDPTNEIYTVHLRPNLTWQDGKPLTANDVVFTYQTIQNPDAQSPLNVSWQNVSITATDTHTVVFKLPNPLSSFIYSLTTGIIPQHILGKIPTEQLRAADFNTTRPIGSGPFQIQALEVIGDTPQNRQEEIQLKPFEHYYAGKPKITTFIVHSFRSEDLMIKSFKSQDINAMVGLSNVPAGLGNNTSVEKYSMPLTAANMVFFKTSTGVLSDAKVRQALVAGADTQQVLQKLGYQAKPVNEPLLIGQLGYNPAYQQSSYNFAQASKLLDQDKWTMGSDGIRYKGGVPLTFGLYTLDDAEYSKVANTLKDQWRKLGVDVNVYLEQNSDMQGTLSSHNYDALLYGISIGIDPDVFVYWDSSQADVRSNSRLNFSEYSSPVADAALEAGRTRTKPDLRTIKYQPFLQSWQQDAPALGLYQTRFLYITRGQVFGLKEHTLNVDTDRYDNVQNWMIRQSLQNVAKN